MNDERKMKRIDLTILEEMVIKVEPNLMSYAIRWPMAVQERSELSIEKPIHIKARASYVMYRIRTLICMLLITIWIAVGSRICFSIARG